MKKIYSLPALLLFGLALASARGAGADSQKTGFYTFFDAVGSNAPTSLELGKEKVKPDGFNFGDLTGGLALPAGQHVFTAHNSIAKHEDIEVEIKPDASTVLVAYLISGPDKPKIRFFLAPASETGATDQVSVNVVYVSGRAGLEVDLNGTIQHLNGLDLFPVPVPNKSIVIKHHADTIGSYSFNEPGNYLVVIYDDDKGDLASKLIPWNLYKKAK